MKDSGVPGKTDRRSTTEETSFIWVLKLSLYLIPGCSMCLHMPPKFHNSAALFCSIPCLRLSYEHTTQGSQAFVKPHIFRHAQTQTSAPSVSQMALAWSCIKQKPRNLRQASEQGTTLSGLPPHPLSPSYTHTHPTRWPPSPYAKNYHTSFSLYPYLNMMEKNWAFIWGGGCVFIQQRQHQETRESPHCC